MNIDDIDMEQTVEDFYRAYARAWSTTGEVYIPVSYGDNRVSSLRMTKGRHTLYYEGWSDGQELLPYERMAVAVGYLRESLRP